MACLVHNARYRSLFHGVVNELRNEKRISVPLLRNMPNKCCTCNDIDKLTLISVLIQDKDNLKNLENLINQVNRDKTSNSKLVLALNRLENFIKENRGSPPEPSLPEEATRRNRSFSSSSSSSSSSTDDDGLVSFKKRKPESKSTKPKKPPKPLKNGIFIFLPYKFEENPADDSAMEVAKQLQRGRFLGRNKYITSVETEHDVRINMITSTTTEQIKKTLINAKAGIGNVKIHNSEALKNEEESNGEWILVRSKKNNDQTDTTALETVLTELENRWSSFLKIKKRKSTDDDDVDDEHSNKK